MDNKFYKTDISKFDPTKASAEDIRKWLFAIIDAELDKDPSERDYDLIEECAAFEMELPELGIEASESELAAGLERIKALVPTFEPQEIKIIKTKKKTKKSVRIITILAASLATLILSLTVAAAVQGKSVVQFIDDSFKSILGMGSGDKIDDEGITLHKYGEGYKYNSLEDAVIASGYDILYPTYLPKEVKVEKIAIIDVDDRDSITIMYISNDESLFVEIYPSDDLPIYKWENTILCENDIIDFYIIKTVDGSYQAVGLYKNMRYSIKYSNYDELINILNGMKGIEK